ncbi:hypothetical protein EHI8A_118540 [Entamoeba histolytica HM-1:IMSS-B]|uniref:Uncharacterized protein n=6 Tax=Entamoeba histolytica TaxID=5759 RepID=C4LTM8_ENTH1|nr:hypothetical protein EHI_012370 [Entamoeba histolytica HM-1:IMSS]EMD43322.1 Hypothetical protein EHI5A_111540 [Entamoeba histolytica KU27]EMH77673.1 hypothetical protein EHI8A_118540 [Entamoeba histolytica HM-1:IMSS-B]EMS12200.1 hypothetical protein KM1_188050 [Entamoeba histolytica HM-3:IMSS]ENY62196.1 hypothetical protein EHI7A_109710 [Entamoeba histolytica HM-1:IMSS-A]GAT91923.1 hypothetical protein CL6EHI_012370 [Entamoeba histolytica]|eukprot:XP_655344.2 hypothetical protein EHI_012370 [Entamoeba histolytica HM-1:IMSS]
MSVSYEEIFKQIEEVETDIDRIEFRITELTEELTKLQGTTQDKRLSSSIQNEIITTERNNFEILCKTVEQVKQLESVTQTTFKSATENIELSLEKNHQQTTGEINTIRDDISLTARVVDSLVELHDEIESNLSLSQIRQFSMKNYLPKISQIAEIMQHHTIYILSELWMCGLIQYETPILCFWNNDKTLAIHLFSSYCLVYQNNQEFKFDISKGILSRVERNPHLKWKDIDNYVYKETHNKEIYTPMGKSKLSFIVSEDNILIRYDSGDMIAIDSLGECIFIDGKLITI